MDKLSSDEIEKLYSDCLMLEEQVKLLVKTELKLRRTQADLIFSKKAIEEHNRTLEKKVRERTEELETANSKLKELDTLKNEFIANISHDFRSPLTVVLNMAKVGQEDGESTERTREFFSLIYKSSLRLHHSINRLLDLAKMDAKGIRLRISGIDLFSTLKEIHEFYSSSVIGSNIRIELRLPREPIGEFYTDIEKLEEILNNILSNAIKFVDINTGHIVIELSCTDENVRIRISDNGIGIGNDEISGIFDRFEQGTAGRKSGYTGTGIGLAFAHKLVGYLNGRIWAESEGKGKGSSFIIELGRDKSFFSPENFVTKIHSRVRNEEIKNLIEFDLECRSGNIEIKKNK